MIDTPFGPAQLLTNYFLDFRNGLVTNRITGEVL